MRDAEPGTVLEQKPVLFPPAPGTGEPESTGPYEPAGTPDPSSSARGVSTHPYQAPAGEPLPEEGPGERLGPYRLIQEIGHGGMGSVYLAEQEEPVRRQVALKIIRPDRDGEQDVVRFEAERQALALMDHPNIARVFDAGATPMAGCTSSWSWSRACRSPASATTTS